jgi:poly(ADP-ribose) glycohydrolase ARH3
LEAHRSVVTAIACFALSPDSYETTIASAVSLGGDVDTVAAMAGAISGAHLGVASLPAHLLGRLEDGPKGRTYIQHLAKRLHDCV